MDNEILDAPYDEYQDRQIHYAPYGNRFIAAFVDGLILMIPGFIINFAVGDLLGSFAGILLNLAYFGHFESSESQATPGKKMMNLKVIDARGGPVSFGQAVGRNLAKYLSLMIFFIGYLMPLWTEKKQALHDIIASAIVIEAYE